MKLAWTFLMTALVIGVTAKDSQAQLVSAFTAPQFDDGSPAPKAVAWLTDVTTGEFVNLPLGAAMGLAADNSRRILYASTGKSISAYVSDEVGGLVQLSPEVQIRNSKGIGAEALQIEGLAFANGLLYASVFHSIGDQSRGRGIEAGFYVINPVTAEATLLKPAAEIPQFKGLDYNPEDGLMYGVTGQNNTQSIVSFDVETFTLKTVANVPASAYGKDPTGPFDGVAVGDGFVYLTSGLVSDLPIAVFDLKSGMFRESLASPPRSGENRYYPGGATYFPSLLGF
jgi:hypothetical protein